MLRKQNAVPAPSLLLVIFKSPQKLPLSSVANASCLWKQFQFTFYNEKNPLPRKRCKYPHCSPALFSLQKRNSLEPHRHWVASTHSFLTPPSSQIVAFKQWPFLFVKASLLFWVGFPSRLFCVSSRVAPRRSRCCRSRSQWDNQGEWAPCAPHPQPCCSWGAVCNHGESQAPGSLSHLHVDGQKPSASHDSHKS